MSRIYLGKRLWSVKMKTPLLLRNVFMKVHLNLRNMNNMSTRAIHCFVCRKVWEMYFKGTGSRFSVCSFIKMLFFCRYMLHRPCKQYDHVILLSNNQSAHSSGSHFHLINLNICKYSETSIKRAPSIKRTLSRVPKLTSYIFLCNEPLFCGRFY